MDLQSRVDELVDRGDVPGAVLGVLAGGEVDVHAAGVLNRRTGVAVTPDSVFQIGSNTKVWTATQVMQFADDGRLDLDDPVRRHLDGFTTGDPQAAGRVTVRDLLTHTSGIEGDVFDDFGRNDDAIEQYVASLAEQGSVHGVGETWSYCNSGYVVLGRLVEVLSGTSWATALRDRIGDPLGLDVLALDADEAIMHRAAVGHVKRPDQEFLEVAPFWSLPQAIAPAGLITTTVGNVLRFAAAHLDDGTALNGTRLLRPESVRAMQTPQVTCPSRALATHWGLGWLINLVGDRTVIGHGGNTVGQSTYFVAVPDRGIAIGLLTNASGARQERCDDVVRGLLADLADLDLPARARPASAATHSAAPHDDLGRLTGTYLRKGVETSIELVDGELRATTRMSGPLAASVGLDRPFSFQLLPSDRPDDFVAEVPELGPGWISFRFYDTNGSTRPGFLHTGGRAARRVA